MRFIVSLLFLCLIQVDGVSQYFGGNKNEKGVSFIEYNNSFFVAGDTRSYGQGSTDVILSEVSNDLSANSSFYLGYPHQDFAADMIQTYDDNYVVLMNSWDVKPYGRTDIGVVKYDNEHNHLWTSFFGGSHNDHSYSIKETLDKGLVITGLNRNEGNLGSVFFRKLDTNGSLEWEKFFDLDEKDLGKDVAQLPDSSFIILAEKNTFFSKISNSSEYKTNTKSDLVLIKTDRLGNELWRKTYGNPGYDFGSKIIYMDDALYVVGSTMDSTTESFDVALRKLDTAGNLIWRKQYGGLGYDYGNYIDYNDNFDLLITGTSSSYSTDDVSQVVCFKIDSSGSELWMKNYGDEVSQEGAAGKFLQNNELAFIGTTESTDKGKEILFFKTTQNGEVISILSNASASKIEPKQLLVFPNPASESFNLRFPRSQTGFATRLSIMNVSGQLIYSTIFKSTIGDNTFSVNYPSGVYIYKIEWEGKVVTGKIIINP